MKNTQHYRDQLLLMREQLLGDWDQLADELSGIANQPGELSTVDQHNADHDSEGLDREVNLLSTERELLFQVNAALNRLDQGMYGRCQNCGKKIDPTRLEAIPYTPWCIACAQQQQLQQE